MSASSGRQPVIIDANPASTDSWGGRINDGFTEGPNVEIRRDVHTNKAYVWAIETITPGSELTVQYGPDYWQEHFFSCPDTVQQAARQCYGLIPIAGQCYQAKELHRLRSIGLAHQVGESGASALNRNPPRRSTLTHFPDNGHVSRSRPWDHPPVPLGTNAARGATADLTRIGRSVASVPAARTHLAGGCHRFTSPSGH